GPRGCRTDAIQVLEDAEPADLVYRVCEHSQDGEHIFDMRRLQELQPAVFDEWNIASGELKLQQIAVVAGAEENRLPAERHALFAEFEHLFAHLHALLVFVGAREQHRAPASGADWPKVLR